MTRLAAVLRGSLSAATSRSAGVQEPQSEPPQSGVHERTIGSSQAPQSRQPVAPTNCSTAELFIALRPQVAGIARMLLGAPPAPELVHDICVDAAMSAASFRGDSAFSSWLYAVVRQHIHKWIRSQCRHRSLLCKYRQQSSTANPIRPDEAISVNHLAKCLNEALTELPKLQLACFVAVQFDGRTISDAANLLGLTPEAVRMNVHRARRHLRLSIGTLLV